MTKSLFYPMFTPCEQSGRPNSAGSHGRGPIEYTSVICAARKVGTVQGQHFSSAI